MRENDQLKYYINCELRDNILFLVGCNDVYMELMGISSCDFGKNVEELSSINYLYRIVYDIIKFGDGDYSIINELKGDFWSVHFRVTGNHFESTGIRCKPDYLGNMLIPQLPALNYFGMDSVYFTCIYKDKKYIVNSINKKGHDLFPVTVDQDISEFYIKHCIFHKSARIYGLCHSNGQKPSYFLEQITYNGKYVYALCILLKYLQIQNVNS